MAFLDKVLGKDEKERKLEKEIHSLELRKESVFAAINGEINRLRAERSNILLAAGAQAYDVWSRDKIQADLMEFWDKVQELDRQIAEQENKRTEMGRKYDEEIRLINSNLNVGSTGMTSPASTGRQCPSCGIPITDNDVFCPGCGAKLK